MDNYKRLIKFFINFYARKTFFIYLVDFFTFQMPILWFTIIKLTFPAMGNLSKYSIKTIKVYLFYSFEIHVKKISYILMADTIVHAPCFGHIPHAAHSCIYLHKFRISMYILMETPFIGRILCKRIA